MIVGKISPRLLTPGQSGAVRPFLEQRSSCSFFCHEPMRLITLLKQRGFVSIPPRGDYELARLRTATGQLAVIYETGATVAQGRFQNETMRLLDHLAGGTA
jgi:hypothetical protein